MFRNCISRGALASAFLICGLANADESAESERASGPIMLTANKWLDNAGSSFSTAVTINGASLGEFESSREVDVTKHLKPGKNTVTFVVTPKGHGKDNRIEFKIGAVQTSPRTKKRTMRPVLMCFRDDHDWSADDEGVLSHPFGPNPKTPDKKNATVSYSFEYAGCAADVRTVKEGDYILKVQPYFAWNPSVVATVAVNGRSLGSFHGGERELVVTDMLKGGDNDFRVVTEPVSGQLYDIDTTFDLIGPVSYDIEKKEFLGPKVTSFKAMQGWKRNKLSHVLEVEKSGAAKQERMVAFRLESAPK
jgi:hypothetical protein